MRIRSIRICAYATHVRIYAYARIRMYAYATHVRAMCMLACCMPHICYAYMYMYYAFLPARSRGTVFLFCHLYATRVCISRQEYMWQNAQYICAVSAGKHINIRVAYVLCFLACSLSRYGLFILCTARSSSRARRSLSTAATTCGQHTSAYVSMRQHTSAYVSMRQHTAAYVSIRQLVHSRHNLHSAYVSIHQHTSAYVSIRQHTSAYVSIRQHASAYVFSLRNLLHRAADCIHIFVICSRAGLTQ
jgi:hypothetical protein